jgi:hypothetical protein
MQKLIMVYVNHTHDESHWHVHLVATALDRQGGPVARLICCRRLVAGAYRLVSSASPAVKPPTCCKWSRICLFT